MARTASASVLGRPTTCAPRLRRFTVADLVAHATKTNEWTLYVSLDDSLGAKDKGTRHLEAVEYHHDHNQSQGKKNPRYTNGTVHVEVRLELGLRSYAYDWRLYLREKTVRRLNRQRAPEHRLHFRKKTSLARDMLEGLQQLLPAGFRVYVLFDSWYASNRLLQWCRRQGWHIICAIKSNRKLGDKKLTTWPQALRHQRYQRVLLTATDGRQRTYLVRTLQGKLNKLSFAGLCAHQQTAPSGQTPEVFSVHRSGVIGTGNPAHLPKALGDRSVPDATYKNDLVSPQALSSHGEKPEGWLQKGERNGCPPLLP